MPCELEGSEPAPEPIPRPPKLLRPCPDCTSLRSADDPLATAARELLTGPAALSSFRTYCSASFPLFDFSELARGGTARPRAAEAAALEAAGGALSRGGSGGGPCDISSEAVGGKEGTGNLV
jgi:hypothetical protein